MAHSNFKDYLYSLYSNTIEYPKKDSKFYYFPFTQADLAKHIEYFKICYERGINAVKALIGLETKIRNGYE